MGAIRERKTVRSFVRSSLLLNQKSESLLIFHFFSSSSIILKKQTPISLNAIIYYQISPHISITDLQPKHFRERSFYGEREKERIFVIPFSSKPKTITLL